MAGGMFAKIGDIKGESRDARHKGEIELLSWAWGVTQSVASGRGGSGNAGKATFADLTFVHSIDMASPILFKSCATGTHIPEALITVRKAGRGQREFLIVKMSDVLITGVHAAVAGATDTTEVVSLRFAKVELEYRPQKADGALAQAVSFRYDLKKNSVI